MKRFTITLLIAALSATASFALAQQSGALPQEAEQVLFLLDDSGSMTATAFDPTDPSTSRWEVVQRVYPQWLERLGQDTLVGAVSVGGACGSSPPINLPVGTDRQQVTAAISSARPTGATNLNAALKAAPGFFAPGVRGGKRIILLSDGLNSCVPTDSTCEIAKQLHQDHGIVIDVVAWVTEPSMVDEFKCVSEGTGGTFTAPRTIEEWVNIPLPVLDPLRYVVLVLGCATLLLASQILYRHGFHALGWGTGQATLAAGILLGLGTLVLYLVLFVGAGVVASLLGAAVLATMLVIAGRRKEQSPVPVQPTASSWTVGLLVALALLMPRTLSASDDFPTSCTKVVQGPPRYHHILGADVSGTMLKHIRHMKSFLACYAEMYALPGEDISLIIFAKDENGGVEELLTFTVPPSGSTARLSRALDDLQIQDPRKTKTYFKPLADFLNQFLQRVRFQPVVLVVSDGKSDGFQDVARDRLNFVEIPFESLGKRGMYTVPGMHGWKVAIQGGSGLDLKALFQRPLTVRANDRRAHAPLAPVIDPCLIEPELLVETDESIILRPPWWNPFAGAVEGSVSIRIRNECVVNRFRSFTVQLRRGEETMDLGRINHTLVGANLRPFTFPVSRSATGARSTEAMIQVSLDEGGANRTVHPYKPSVITLEEVPYLSAFGVYWSVLLCVLFSAVGLTVFAVQQRQEREHNRPEVVKVLGGHGVPLFRSQPASIGGEGCQMVVPGVGPGVILALAEWAGTRGELVLRPGPGVQMKVNGIDVAGSGTYRLGQPIQFIDAHGTSYDVTLHAGKPEDVGFGTTVSGGGSDPVSGGTFPGFGGFAFPDSGSGFGSTSRGSGGNGTGANTDTYI
jgi:hypothetical protein